MTMVLETQNLNKWYPLGGNKRTDVLKGIDLEIRKGEFVSIMGPSGSGKSTLLYTVSGMDRASSGRVCFLGREISRLQEKELSRLRLGKMGFIFQQIHLMKNLNLLDNISLPAYAEGVRSRSEIDHRARYLMNRTGIGSLARNSVDQASGGQLQRVGICRALMSDPKIIFGDEPTGALNSTSAKEIMDLLADIHRSGTTILLVTHDVRVAAKTERVLFMYDGKIAGEYLAESFNNNGNGYKTREEHLASWLTEMKF